MPFLLPNQQCQRLPQLGKMTHWFSSLLDPQNEKHYTLYNGSPMLVLTQVHNQQWELLQPAWLMMANIRAINMILQVSGG